MAYSGTYIPAHPQKYRGDSSKIYFRSLWERAVFKYCEQNPHIEWWSSEELVIEYTCMTDKKKHRYYPDLIIKYTTGLVVIVEIKPYRQTIKPVITKNKNRQTLLNESITYTKNISKWLAAKEYARQNNLEFQIWTEKTLEAMGIKTLTRYKK